MLRKEQCPVLVGKTDKYPHKLPEDAYRTRPGRISIYDYQDDVAEKRVGNRHIHRILAICMALGLPEDGHIDTLEINDELEDLIEEGFSRAGVSDKISLHIGDAMEFLAAQQGKKEYDLTFIDANKREYPDYYEHVLALTRTGGFILADDVLWDGKVYAEHVPSDKQTAGIVRFNDLAAQDPRVETVILPVRHGLSIIRKK